MATVFDIASWSIPAQSVGAQVASAAIAITANPVTEVDFISVPTPGQVATTQIVTAGPQGPPGDQNVYVGTTPPVNPQVGWVWIDTS